MVIKQDNVVRIKLRKEKRRCRRRKLSAEFRRGGGGGGGGGGKVVAPTILLNRFAPSGPEYTSVTVSDRRSNMITIVTSLSF